MAKKIKENHEAYSKIEISRENKVSEPYNALSYEGNYGLEAFTAFADAPKQAGNHLTAFEKMNLVREGISKKDLEILKDKTSMDYTMLAKALSVTRATLINKKRDQKFGAGLSEKIVGLADLYSYGFEVFEDEDNFNQWMTRPNQALGGRVPYDLIDNQYGREEVKNLIGRIDYGVYS